MKFEDKRLTLLDKVLWLDVETTGLEPSKNAVIQIGAVYEEKGQIVDSFSSYVKPHVGAMISKQALEVNNITPEMMKDFPCATQVCAEFISFLKKHCIPDYAKSKLLIAGYNINFDIGFMHSFFKINSTDSYSRYFTRFGIDVGSKLLECIATDAISRPESFSLESVCKHVGLSEYHAHEAVSDAIATRQLYHKLIELYNNPVNPESF